LSARHIHFIALGSAIGTGLFYGSAEAIEKAGPAVLVAYLVAGAAVDVVITGWTFAFEMAIVALADVTAFGVYRGFWFPAAPRWIWVLAVALAFMGLVLVVLGYFEDTRTALYVGAAWLVLLVLAYRIWVTGDGRRKADLETAER